MSQPSIEKTITHIDPKQFAIPTLHKVPAYLLKNLDKASHSRAVRRQICHNYLRTNDGRYGAMRRDLLPFVGPSLAGFTYIFIF